MGLVTLLAAEVGLGASGVRGWLPFVVMLPPPVLGLWWLGRIRVAVTSDEFQVDDARLPLDVVAQVIALDAESKRLLLGPASDPLAFVIQRPWITGAVQVVLDDSEDPTPYWVISSRHPEKLAAALVAGKRSVSQS